MPELHDYVPAAPPDLPATHEQAVATATLSATQGFPVFERLGVLMQGLHGRPRATPQRAWRSSLAGVDCLSGHGGSALSVVFPESAGRHIAAHPARGRITRAGGGLWLRSRRAGRVFTLQSYIGLEVSCCSNLAPGELRAEDSSAPSAVQYPQVCEVKCFRQARDLARHQQAKALELRADYRESQPPVATPGQTCRGAGFPLAPVYGWFTEGFDTADLQEARALLEALG